jgi:hypothetical protein
MSIILSNKNDDIYLSSQAIVWISKILSNRIGNEVLIQRNDDKSYSFCLANNQGKIIFDSLVKDFINPDVLIDFTKWDSIKEGIPSILELPIPAPGYKILNEPLIEKKENIIYFHYDLLGLIYWSLARVEEYKVGLFDKHNRFPVHLAHSKIYNYLDRPIVDEWIEILKHVILLQWPNVVFKKYDFNLILSHDVDRPFLYFNLSFKKLIRICVGDIIKRRNLFKACVRLYKWYMVNFRKHFALDPFYTFDFIMEEAEKKNLTCMFYFISGNSNNNYDADYKITDKNIIDLIKKIQQRGHLIGLHPSYETYLDPNLIKSELNQLDKTCQSIGLKNSYWESRMHYLRFSIKYTCKFLSTSGISRDSTLNFAEESGFRCGTCFDYIFFDHLTQSELNILERPLIVMDNNFISTSHKFNIKNGINNAKILKERCRKVSGNFTILWHNSELHNEQLKKAFIECIS